MYKKYFKRIIDFSLSLIALLLIWPILLCVTIWLHFANKGAGAFFYQERPGKNGKIFKIIKFKSMTDERDEDGNLLPEAQRLTRIGAFIRKTSIDELPQLINVLKGDMSLVGPRPEVPHYVRQFKEDVPFYLVRQQVRPGMTGWAQINGLRGDTSIEDRVKYDIWYIENWSLWLDIKILWKTVFGGFLNSEVIDINNNEHK